MASYNNGVTHESGKAVVRNTGHCILVSRVETDTKELCWPLANYGKGLLPVAEAPSGPTPPPSAGLSRWWNAGTPLLSAEGDSVVYTKVGTPTVGTAHGLDAIKFNATTENYIATSPILDSTGISFVLYILLSRTASLTYQYEHFVGGLGNGGFEHVSPGIYGATYSSPHATFGGTDDEDTNDGPQSVLNQAQVLVLEYTVARKMRAGLDGVFTPFTVDANPAYTFVNHAIGSVYPAAFRSLIDTWIMDALVYEGVSYDQDVVDWLLAKTS